MGLDYTVYLAIRDKQTKVNQHIIEIAYWRKGWSIRDELNSIADKPIYSLPDAYDKSDIWHTCSPAVLQAVVDLFKDNMNDIMCDLWTNSIFSAVSPIPLISSTFIKNVSCNGLVSSLYSPKMLLNTSDSFCISSLT